MLSCSSPGGLPQNDRVIWKVAGDISRNLLLPTRLLKDLAAREDKKLQDLILEGLNLKHPGRMLLRSSSFGGLRAIHVLSTYTLLHRFAQLAGRGSITFKG
jgi:hypothetical protein